MSSSHIKLTPASPQIQHLPPSDVYTFFPFSPRCNSFYLLFTDYLPLSNPPPHLSKPAQTSSLLKNICRAPKSGSIISSPYYSRSYFCMFYKTAYEVCIFSLTEIMLLGLRDHVLITHFCLPPSLSPPSQPLENCHPHSRDSARFI